MTFTVSVKSLSAVEVFEKETFTELNDALICAKEWNIVNSPPVEITVTDDYNKVHFKRTTQN